MPRMEAACLANMPVENPFPHPTSNTRASLGRSCNTIDISNSRWFRSRCVTRSSSKLGSSARRSQRALIDSAESCVLAVSSFMSGYPSSGFLSGQFVRRGEVSRDPSNAHRSHSEVRYRARHGVALQIGHFRKHWQRQHLRRCGFGMRKLPDLAAEVGIGWKQMHWSWIVDSGLDALKLQFLLPSLTLARANSVNVEDVPR